MANDTKKRDLREGMSRIEPTTNAQMAGHSDQSMPMNPTGEHSVKPLAGNRGGVAEGQGTKSN
jgi:hypothetical protein